MARVWFLILIGGKRSIHTVIIECSLIKVDVVLILKVYT